APCTHRDTWRDSGFPAGRGRDVRGGKTAATDRSRGSVTTSDRRVRVVVGDDHPVYRDGVVRALDASDCMEVVAAVGEGRAALDAIREHAPDVALLDYKMPGIDGIAVAHAVVRDRLGTKVLLVTATTEG